MGRPQRKLEPYETTEARVINAVRYAFGSPEVKLEVGDNGRWTLSICLGLLDGGEVWLEVPCAIRHEPVGGLQDSDEDRDGHGG